MNTAQGIEIDPDHLRLKRCRHGMMLFNVNDQYIGPMLDRYGEFSEGEIDVFRQFVKPGTTVVEVGANIGPHTLALAQMTGVTGHVLTFEPQRVVFQILCANLAINGIEQVAAHWAAVGNEPGHILVPHLNTKSNTNFAGLPLGKWEQGERVSLVTIDSFDLPACHFIKIDVEGMEANVLRGASDTIRRHRPVLYVENDREEKSAELIELLLELDYQCYWHLPPYVRSPNFRENTTNDFPGMVSINLLCCPQSRNITVNGLREVSGPDDVGIGVKG